MTKLNVTDYCITYEVSCVPFQVIPTLKQLSSDEPNNVPYASKVLEKHFYVDDALSGAHYFKEAQRLKQVLTELLAQGGFKLRKWNSNCSSLSDMSGIDRSLDNSISLFNLKWNTKSDNLKIIL